LIRAISSFACLLFHALDVSLSLWGISETVSVGNAGTVSALFAHAFFSFFFIFFQKEKQPYSWWTLRSNVLNE
jgi:hypothetical protein